MQTYIGVKMIQAEPMTKDEFFHEPYERAPGYKVVYPDGYESWSPKDAFEKAYFPISDDGTITEDEVMCFVEPDDILTSKLGAKTTVVQARCLTGFELTETSACVEPDNYDQEMGCHIALGRIKDTLWGHLGFVLQWAKNGLG